MNPNTGRRSGDGGNTGFPLQFQHIPPPRLLPIFGPPRADFRDSQAPGLSEVFMHIVFSSNCATALIAPCHAGEAVELVRGKEEALLEQLNPLVLSQSVTLDMRHVHRIDAAGIAALISLYCVSAQSGHRFTLSRATPRVEEILLLVGLESILVSQADEPASQRCPELELTAA
jgi:anti-anti-sigma regulatory factor